MRIVLLSIIALLINYVANGQTNRPIGGNALDTALIQGSLRVQKNVRFDQYPNAVISTDANGKVVPLNTSDVLNLKTFDTAYRYSVSGNQLFMSKAYSTSVQGLTWINDSNAILVYRDDTSNGHVSNSAVLYYQRLVNNQWNAPAVLYDSEYDDRYGQFYKSITGDTLISQIRRVQLSPLSEMGVYNAYSTNGGATISTYQLITTPANYIPYGIVPAEGKYYQLWTRGDTIKLYRSDNGLTAWTLISTVTQGIGSLEPTLVYTGNNRFIVLTRVLTSGINDLRQFVSTDLGSSFSNVGYAPFGNVQPSMVYDSKRNLVIAISTQRKNATVVGEFQGYINVWVGKPSEISTDTSKWVPIATLHRPIPNVKPFPGAGYISAKDYSTFLFFVTDAMQCDTGVIGDDCDKTVAYLASVTYSDKMLSNISDGVSGFVYYDSIGNPSIRDIAQPFALSDDSSAIFRFDMPLVFQQNPFNQYGLAWYIVGSDNIINTSVYKDGRSFFNSEATFGSDVNVTGNIDGEGAISTGQPPHIASNPDIRFGGVRDTAGTKQWGIRIGTTNYWGLLSTDGNFGFLSGSGSNTSTYLAMFDADGKLTNSSFRSQTGFNQSLQPLIISGSASAPQFGAQIYSLNNANGEKRWDLAVLNSEVGSNIGSNYVLRAYDDNQNYLFPVLTVIRANGDIYTYNNFIADGSITSTGQSIAYREITAATTITTDDYFINATANTFTQPLPTVAAGVLYEITNTGAGVITLDPTGTISGASTADIPAGETAKIISIGGGNYLLRND